MEMSNQHSMYLCRECARPGRIEDNQTYCEVCGSGVELVAVPDEAAAYGNDCPKGACEL